MIFPFLKYISPIWYFNLRPIGNIPYFPDFELLDEEDQRVIEWDAHYSSREVSKLDAAYQAWNRGIIVSRPELKIRMANVIPTVSDNYRFARKYFHPLWSVYVLVIRLLSFKNPLKEIISFWRQRSVQRVNLCAKVIDHQKALKEFYSQLLEENPRVAVIIPTLNRYPWLKDALKDLEEQDYKNFEVIVVDQSDPFQPAFYETFKLNIQLVRQEEKALWLARNSAIKRSKAEYLLLYDDDSRTEPDWISQHLKCLDYFDAEISSGVSLSVVGAKVPKNYAFYRWSDQLDTGNAMVKRAVFRELGIFDRQFERQRQGDGEFGLRAYLAGFKNISNPNAKRIHLKVGDGGLRQMGSWDGWRPKSWWAPRPVPSVLYLIRRYFGYRASIFSILKDVPFSVVPYKYKGRKFFYFLFIPIVVLRLPITIWQVYKSWKRSSHMLNQGPKIQRLET